MFDMSAIQSAKKNASVNQDKNSEDYGKILKEGIDLYNQFTETQNESKLKKAADKFYEALSLKRSQMEPYLFLAMIFFIFEEEEKAKRYFSGAAELVKDKPEYAEFFGYVKQTLYQISA